MLQDIIQKLSESSINKLTDYAQVLLAEQEQRLRNNRLLLGDFIDPNIVGTSQAAETLGSYKRGNWVDRKHAKYAKKFPGCFVGTKTRNQCGLIDYEIRNRSFYNQIAQDITGMLGNFRFESIDIAYPVNHDNLNDKFGDPIDNWDRKLVRLKIEKIFNARTGEVFVSNNLVDALSAAWGCPRINKIDEFKFDMEQLTVNQCDNGDFVAIKTIEDLFETPKESVLTDEARTALRNLWFDIHRVV